MSQIVLSPSENPYKYPPNSPSTSKVTPTNNTIYSSKTLPMKKNHLNLDSVNEVPDTHKWSTVDDHPISPDPLPLIDLANPNAISKLSQACQNFGAFQLIGHGVSLSLLNKLESQLLRLFSLPIETKMKTARTEDDVSGYGVVPIANFFSKQMWSEGFTFAGSPLEHARKLWPDDPMRFCNVIEEYGMAMKALVIKLINLMLLSLDLDDDGIRCTTADLDLTGAVRLNSYPACPEPARAMGMAAHTDSSLVTILYQNSTPGLQVLCTGPHQWATAPAVNGSLIVILGDLFQIFTNGRFRSGFHRAVVNNRHRRLSAAYFCGPKLDRVLPVGKLVDPKRGPCYRGVTWPEYKDLKAKLFQDALDYLKM